MSNNGYYLIGQAYTAGAGITLLENQDVTGFDNIGLSFQAGPVRQLVTVDWTDQLETVAIATRSLVFNNFDAPFQSNVDPGCSRGGIIIPNRGPLVSVTAVNNAGAAGAKSLSARIWGTNLPPFSFGFIDVLNDGPLLLEQLNNVVGAGTDVDIPLNAWYCGQASVWCFAGPTGAAAASTIDFYRKDENGVDHLIDQFYRTDSVTSANGPRNIQIPPFPCFVRFHNGSAAALSFFCVIQPVWTGL